MKYIILYFFISVIFKIANIQYGITTTFARKYFPLSIFPAFIATFSHLNWQHLIINIGFFLFLIKPLNDLKVKGWDLIIFGTIATTIGIILTPGKYLLMGSSGIVFTLMGYVIGKWKEHDEDSKFISIIFTFIGLYEIYNLFFRNHEGVAIITHIVGIVAGFLYALIR